MSSVFLRDGLQAVLATSSPIFLSDRRTDGDSLGAVCALALLWRDIHKRDPVIILSATCEERYVSLPGVQWCTTVPSPAVFAQADAVVVCDCSEEEYVRDWSTRLSPEAAVINIDHHATNTRYGTMNIVMTNSPSTTCVVAQMCVEARLEPSPEAATGLLLGILFDTNLFQNSATSALALELAARCVRWGATISTVLRCLYGNRSVEALRLWGLVFERLRQHQQLSLVSTYLRYAEIERLGKGDGASLDGLVDFLHVVVEMDTFCFFKETMEGDVKLSMRTRSKNVARLAQVCGGGGHTKAAGCTVFASWLDDRQVRQKGLVKISKKD